MVYGNFLIFDLSEKVVLWSINSPYKTFTKKNFMIDFMAARKKKKKNVYLHIRQEKSKRKEKLQLYVQKVVTHFI